MNSSSLAAFAQLLVTMNWPVDIPGSRKGWAEGGRKKIVGVLGICSLIEEPFNKTVVA